MADLVVACLCAAYVLSTSVCLWELFSSRRALRRLVHEILDLHELILEAFSSVSARVGALEEGAERPLGKGECEGNPSPPAEEETE